MPICDRRSFAFIHIPKTGGSSISKMLGLEHERNFLRHDSKTFTFDGVDFAPQHLTPQHLRKLVAGFDDLKTFCFTRHPYQKAVSEFFWLQPGGNYFPDIEYTEERFREWVRIELSKKDCDHKLDQYLYTKDCDHVFTYDMLADAPALLRGIGIEIEDGVEVPHCLMPKYSMNQIASTLSRETCELIEDAYPNDFEILGYERRFTPEPDKELRPMTTADECHIEGDKAYHDGNQEKAIELWEKGAALGSEQCRKNLEWIEREAFGHGSRKWR